MVQMKPTWKQRQTKSNVWNKHTQPCQHNLLGVTQTNISKNSYFHFAPLNKILCYVGRLRY